VAEDFAAAFGLGVGNKSIGLGDIDGVNFAAVQALEARTTEFKHELAKKNTEMAELRAEVAQLRKLVESLARTQLNGAASPPPR
jgi:hypothetical protein